MPVQVGWFRFLLWVPDVPVCCATRFLLGPLGLVVQQIFSSWPFKSPTFSVACLEKVLFLLPFSPCTPSVISKTVHQRLDLPPQASPRESGSWRFSSHCLNWCCSLYNQRESTPPWWLSCCKLCCPTPQWCVWWRCWGQYCRFGADSHPLRRRQPF